MAADQSTSALVPVKAFPDASLQNRFWHRVEVNGPVPVSRPDLGPCWLWTGSRTGVGYGQVSFRRWPHTVHRLVWELYFGPPPDGLFVLHACDVRHCCNPAHLFLGTPADNSRDMVAKGRSCRGRRGAHPNTARGERSGRAKLTARDVADIRRRYAAGGVTQKALGDEYGVSGAHICGIVKGRFWTGGGATDA